MIRQEINYLKPRQNREFKLNKTIKKTLIDKSWYVNRVKTKSPQQYRQLQHLHDHDDNRSVAVAIR